MPASPLFLEKNKTSDCPENIRSNNSYSLRTFESVIYSPGEEEKSELILIVGYFGRFGNVGSGTTAQEGFSAPLVITAWGCACRTTCSILFPCSGVVVSTSNKISP